jgi:hypothetical protein
MLGRVTASQITAASASVLPRLHGLDVLGGIANEAGFIQHRFPAQWQSAEREAAKC